MKRYNKFSINLKRVFKRVMLLMLNFLEIVTLFTIRVLIRIIRRSIRFCKRRGAAIAIALRRFKDQFGELLYKYGEMVFSSEPINIYSEEELLKASYVIETKAKASPVELSWDFSYTNVKPRKWLSDLQANVRTSVYKVINTAKVVETSTKVHFAIVRMQKRIRIGKVLTGFENPSGLTGKVIEYQKHTTTKIINFIAAVRKMIKEGFLTFPKPMTPAYCTLNTICFLSDDDNTTNKGERLYDLRE